MIETPGPPADTAGEPGAAALPLLPSRPPLPRWMAALQVVLVCGIPTQVVIGIAVIVTMFVKNRSLIEGNLLSGNPISLEIAATVSFLDTAAIALLIRIFLAYSGEDSRDVFFGARPKLREALLGLVLVPASLAALQGIVYAVRYLAPNLHNVDESPLKQYMSTPMDAAIFFVVVVLAGGIREELQRAFILKRFEQRLGGIKIGLAAFSLLFAVLHFDQGWDAAIAVGSLGVFWGVLYIRRRSAIMAMTNHAGVNGVQVLIEAIQRAAGQ